MDDDLKFVAKIQRYYDVLTFKKSALEDKAMSGSTEDRKCLAEKINIMSDLIQEFDSIFKDFLYKDKA